MCGSSSTRQSSMKRWSVRSLEDLDAFIQDDKHLLYVKIKIIHDMMTSNLAHYITT